jgi:hypothetical protein
VEIGTLNWGRNRHRPLVDHHYRSCMIQVALHLSIHPLQRDLQHHRALGANVGGDTIYRTG